MSREQRSAQADSEAKKTRTPVLPFSEMAQVTQKSLDDLYERLMMGVNTTTMRTELASFATKAEISWWRKSKHWLKKTPDFGP
ncbi:Hypothetical protein NTJ_11341 [Nesidiocoris tenuis]|uniref:Uncharacterized protein n=1 Tax=Nesidiocoris tenuis TaxID=355587 RepID=A0ABN7B278_9HEMI|nr:Hypothetical protein NTJ_11341 [Nesidiocoris tenuis]